MHIRYHPQFEKSYKKLSPEIQRKSEKREILFRKNLFDPRLQTHKLHGKLKHLWSFSVDRKYRVVFEFMDSEIMLLDIGDHKIYK